MAAPSLKWVHKHSQAPENDKIKVKDFHTFPCIPNRMNAIAFNVFDIFWCILYKEKCMDLGCRAK